MQFLTLWQGFLDSLVTFFMAEPISGFLGVFILFAVWGLVEQIIGRDRRM